eukprot:scaffold10093_cov56-Phaeocystis_antarctica.AAC.3
MTDIPGEIAPVNSSEVLILPNSSTAEGGFGLRCWYPNASTFVMISAVEGKFRDHERSPTSRGTFPTSRGTLISDVELDADRAGR